MRLGDAESVAGCCVIGGAEGSSLWRDAACDVKGQSLLEVAVMMPLLVLLMGYAIDFGYFFVAAANVTSAARNAAEYSVQGYQSPGQGSLPVAGPAGTLTSVTATALGDMASLLHATALTRVEVCTKALGMSGNTAKCGSYGAAGATYAAAVDPEAPRFVLQQVDVTYTIQPPVPMSLFTVSLLPSMEFHRRVVMRAMD